LHQLTTRTGQKKGERKSQHANTALRIRGPYPTLNLQGHPLKSEESIMKVTINVECTPEEARAFFGLPDVQPMQTAMMDEMQKRMKDGMASMDMDNLMKMWMPGVAQSGMPGAMSGGVPGLDQFQKMFWDSMAAATNMAPGSGKAKKGASKKT